MNTIHLGSNVALGKTLTLFKKSVLSLMFLVGSLLTAQQSVSGTVVDPAGVPLPGVNVVIKGTNTGVSTDFDGNFSIEADDTDVLIFSFVGFKDQESTVGNNTSFSISLEEEASFLDEIIVTGYGTQTRREVTASIVRVDSETIELLV